jgi:transposase
MGYIKGLNREQIVLLPNSLEDYVSEENPVRVIEAFVDKLDIAALGFKAEAAAEGRPGYDPRDMLKLYIYGYYNKIRSSRRLQTEAGRNIELIWLLRKIVPDFHCIADFRKDYAKPLKKVFHEFVSLCNYAELVSHETVVIDGSKFRAVNSDNNCYIKKNVEKLIEQTAERIEKYLAKLNDNDKSENNEPGELTTTDIKSILEYLDKRKTQLTTALAAIEGSDGNQLCTTDPECRLMKTRDGFKPSFNVQTAVEPDNHIIVNFEVTNECADWNLLESGINGAKEALGVDTLEGIADKGYSNDNEVLNCLLNGDTPTIYPNKNQNCRTFKFTKTEEEITPEMIRSENREIKKQCISAGVLPDVLRRPDIKFEIVPISTPQQYIDRESGEIVSYEQMKQMGGKEREKVEVSCEPPLQPYFTRDLESDTVTCPMGQTLFYAGVGWPNGKKGTNYRRYWRLSVCQKCGNKCTAARRRVVSFKDGETHKSTNFYEHCHEGEQTVRSQNLRIQRRFVPISGSKLKNVVVKYYPNQRKLRIRNQIVEHPYGTVKRWNDGYYLLVKGKIKAAAELALAFLSYNLKRAVNLLGTKRLIALITAR